MERESGSVVVFSTTVGEGRTGGADVREGRTVGACVGGCVGVMLPGRLQEASKTRNKMDKHNEMTFIFTLPHNQVEMNGFAFIIAIRTIEKSGEGIKVLSC